LKKKKAYIVHESPTHTMRELKHVPRDELPTINQDLWRRGSAVL